MPHVPRHHHRIAVDDDGAVEPELTKTPEPVQNPTPASSGPVAPDDAGVRAEIILGGDGIDPTGAVVSTAAVQGVFASAPAGSTVIVPGGAVIALDEALQLDRLVHLRGTGELRFVGGVANSAAIAISADGVTVADLTLSNPDRLGTPTGGRNVGIDIRASDVTVDGATVDGFQNGILNQPQGEYTGVMVRGCRVVNITGAGGGPGSDSSNGEDRGDGITIWGARASVIGNLVSAAPGTDARIGIHAESLPGYAATPGPWADSMIVIEGNVVAGPFRRGIALEGVAHALVSGNTVSDSTWWGIAATDTRAAGITGNTVRWTRTDADDHGSSWSPLRCAIMLYRDAQGTTVDGNVIEISGSAAAGIAQHAAPLFGEVVPRGATDTVIAGNLVRITGGSCPVGVSLDHAAHATVSGNRLRVTQATGSRGGIIAFECSDAVLTDNSISGASPAAGFGIHHQGAGSVVVTGNRIDTLRVGIAVVNCVEGATIVANTVRGCEFGLDTYGTTGRSVIGANRWDVSVTAHANAQPATSYLSTRHMGSARPYGGASGDLLVGNGKLWVNDRGTWSAVPLS